jgi:hypothetical protein
MSIFICIGVWFVLVAVIITFLFGASEVSK